MSNLAIYIHWPFCAAKCPYCDFNSHVRDLVDHARWKSALLRELLHYLPLLGNRRVTSIFFGGGTPSLMQPDTVGALIQAVQSHWQIANDIEITLEANPTSVEVGTLAAFKDAGINRVSLGIQSLREEELRFLGRKHSVAQALRALETAGSLFDRMTFDLIYARPNQTVSDWEAELKQALSFARGHLSLYQLTIEENTPFYQYYQQKRFELPPEDVAADMYTLTHTLTQEHGLPLYEVSNYATPGQESRHNLSYWRGDDYIGIGPGAHGRYTLSSPGGERIATRGTKLPEKWLTQVEELGHGVAESESVSAESTLDERILMGLRVREGIEYDRFRAQTGRELIPLLNPQKLEWFVQNGHLVRTDTHLAPSLSGMLVLNHITHELLS